MYKVFFNDRMVFITSEERHIANHDYRAFWYKNIQELNEMIARFIADERIRNLAVLHTDLAGAWNDFQNYFKVIHAAGGLVQNTNGDLLVIHRFGVPDLPKGKMERGEDLELTAIREVEEECGLLGVLIQKPLLTTYHTYPLKGSWILKHTHWYSMKYDGDAPLVPQTKEDITKAEWVNKKGVKTLMSKSYASLRDLLNFAGWL